MSKVIVIGAGPAGMMAAISASKNHKVILIERNEKIGKKLYITGKGRCNVTNAKDISEFFDYIPVNPSFLYSSLYSFTNLDTINFLEKAGVKLKVERGDRVFPESDKSSDIIQAFSRELKKNNIEIIYNTRIVKFNNDGNIIKSVVTSNNNLINGDYFILCTGGKSYPLTGSTGDGYKLSSDLGHNIITPKPALAPIEIIEDWVKELQGLSLKNIEINLLKKGKTVYTAFGEMLFTHFGISGPIVLTASGYVNKLKPEALSINLKPALSKDELDQRIQRDFKNNLNKDFKNSLNEILPQRLIDTMVKLSGIDENKKVNSITKDERKKLVELLQNLPMTIKGLRKIEEAIVTSGGIDVKEIDSSTMKSKIMDNLYFAGEVIDVDGFTGGFNIQIALSTGYLAGSRVGEK